MRTKMEVQKKWIKTYVFFNICQKSNWIQKVLVLSFLCVSKCLYGKSRVNIGFPQKNMLWFYLIPGSSHIFFCFFFGIMMYDKKCDADENKIWIKDEIKPQQISNHTRSHSVVIPKWKRETKKKKRNTSFQILNWILYEPTSSLYVVELVTDNGRPRPSDNGVGDGHSDSEIRGRPSLKKIFYGPSGLSLV